MATFNPFLAFRDVRRVYVESILVSRISYIENDRVYSYRFTRYLSYNFIAQKVSTSPFHRSFPSFRNCKPTEIIFTIFQNRRYTSHDGTQRDEGKREKTETAKLHFAPIHRHDLSMVLLASRDRSPVSIDARDHLMDLLTRENHNADETERDTTSVISVGIYRARMRNV